MSCAWSLRSNVRTFGVCVTELLEQQAKPVSPNDAVIWPDMTWSQGAVDPPLRITPFWYDYTMALNIKDAETEQLAADVASLAGESKTAAIRQALRERRQRLLRARGGRGRGDRMVDVLEARLWPKLPARVRGIPVTRAEREAILGYGPEGV